MLTLKAAQRGRLQANRNTSARRAVSCNAVKYKGLAVHKPGEQFKLWEYEQEPLAATDVEIQVTHNGLCHTDLHMKDDDWGLTSYPLIAGHEVVGTVKQVGSGVQGIKVGDRVGVGWIRNSCRRCPQCLRGNENLCAKGYTGLIVGPNMFGGFQPIMRAPGDFTYVLPDNLSSAAAAPLLCAGVTVYAPLRKHIRKPAAKVAILGVGGLGHLGVQFAAKMGAEVTAIDIDPSKEKEAHQLGANNFVEFNTAYTQCKQHFDVILNCVAARINFSGVLGMLAYDGVAIQCGIPGGGAVIDLNLQEVVFGQKGMVGSIVGGRADMEEMLRFCAEKGVEPMIETMKLTQVGFN
eukprot:GHUV01012283.1.p1 GENE.GHUV01012283.1~~GHUV01012283.1.p1  ORF type:complete len:349 (+),score=57.72 GHUV01012283.1:194-1240(+)